jgi:hypothetical protein
MKKLILAACVAALGMPVSAQQPSTPEPPKPNIDYGYYGGPSSAPVKSRSTAPRVTNRPGVVSGPYQLYGVPDDLTMAEQEQQRIRDAAVEFGRFRRQFTGSTEFWMDHHRTDLAKARYAMDESMWRAIHPPEAFGDGGYLYHTAPSVGGAFLSSSQPVYEDARPVAAPVVSAPAATVTPAAVEAPVPAVRPRTSTAPRVIAGSKPVYDAASSVGREPTSK